MRYGTENYADTGTIAITNVVSALAGTSTLVDNRTVRSYVATQDGSDVTITVSPGSAKAVDMIALVNTTGITSVDVEVLNSSVSQATASGTVTTPVQQTYCVIPITATGDEITITFDAGDTNQFSIGYLYVGSLSTDLAIRAEALNYSVESADPVNLTRAGTSLTSDAYLYSLIEMTVTLELFSTLRDRVKLWAADGYATPRLWYFPEACIMTGEAVWAIIDSSTLQIDPVYDKPEYQAEMTIGIREVY